MIEHINKLVRRLTHKVYDLVRRVEKLEKDSHPPIGLCEFDGFEELVKRIDEIEKKQAERFPHLIKRLEDLEK